MTREHDWRRRSDAFICMKCCQLFHCTRDKVFPPKGDKCIGPRLAKKEKP